MPFSLTVSRTCFYPGTTQILLSFNVNTRHTIPWPTNATTTGRDLKLVCFYEGQLWMSTETQALNRSMSQLGHNPHSYNPVNYQRHYHWARSRKLSMSTYTATILWTINVTTTGRDLQLVCFNEGQLWMLIGTQALNQSMSQLGHHPHHVYQNRERLLSCSKLFGVSISTIFISSV